MKRFVLPLLLLTSLLLAACGGGSTAAPTSAPEQTAPTSAPEVKPTTAAATDAPAAAAATTAATAATATTAPAATAAPAATQPAAPVLPVGDPKAVVIKAIKAQLTAGPSRTLTLVETSDSKTQLTSEMVLPDRLHIVMESDGKRVSETIIISDTMWTRTGDGAWNSSPGGAAMLSMMGEKEIDATTNSITDVKLVGPELLNGTPTWVYTFTSDRADLGVTSQVKIWIGALTGLPLQQQVEGEVGGTKSKTTQTITYDPSIKIEAPAK